VTSFLSVLEKERGERRRESAIDRDHQRCGYVENPGFVEFTER
jgi:hypothetical protein